MLDVDFSKFGGGVLGGIGSSLALLGCLFGAGCDGQAFKLTSVFSFGGTGGGGGGMAGVRKPSSCQTHGIFPRSSLNIIIAHVSRTVEQYDNR